MEQIIKGWVRVSTDLDSGEVFLLKRDSSNVEWEDDGRQLRILISNALEKLGFSGSSNDEDYEDGISERYIAEGVKLQLFGSNKRAKLEEIKQNALLDAMGMLEFQENWYGYSSWTIEGFNTETFKLGGHDILSILEQHEGKFVYLVIDKVSYPTK